MDKVIKSILKGDLQSRTAQAVLDLIEENGLESEFEFLDSTGKVPIHCYTSLSKLLFGADNKTAELDKVICRIEGTLSNKEIGIDIQYASEEDGEVPGMLPPDSQPEAKYALLKILVRMDDAPEDGSKDDLLEHIENRIQFLIDFKCREMRARCDNSITSALDPVGIDPSIHPDYGVTCTWLKNVTASHVLNRASIYRVEYVTVMTP